MPTKQTEILDKVWTIVATGPTEVPISVEVNGNYERCYLALGTAAPVFVGGHSLPPAKTRQVNISSGESLYAYVEYSFKTPVYLVISS